MNFLIQIWCFVGRPNVGWHVCISVQGLGQVSLKGLTTGQMCKSFSDFVGVIMSIWVQGVGVTKLLSQG